MGFEVKREGKWEPVNEQELLKLLEPAFRFPDLAIESMRKLPMKEVADHTIIARFNPESPQ